nr:hypothetical protein [Tanacetum cinerariifolium]
MIYDLTYISIPDHRCDVPSHDNSPPLDVSKDQFEDLFESNEEFSSTDDDSFSFDKIDYVEASPPDSELVSSEVMEIVIPEVGGIDDDILLTIKDDILRENLLNVNHLFAKIEASNDNPTLFYDPIISGTPPNLTPSGENEFAGELTLLKSIPPGIDETDCDFEEDICERIPKKDKIGSKPDKKGSVKENQENDKIESKPDKNGKRGEAGKRLKQLQWVEQEKLSKTQKE